MTVRFPESVPFESMALSMFESLWPEDVVVVVPCVVLVVVVRCPLLLVVVRTLVLCPLTRVWMLLERPVMTDEVLLRPVRMVVSLRSRRLPSRLRLDPRSLSRVPRELSLVPVCPMLLTSRLLSVPTPFTQHRPPASLLKSEEPSSMDRKLAFFAPQSSETWLVRMLRPLVTLVRPVLTRDRALLTSVRIRLTRSMALPSRLPKDMHLLETVLSPPRVLLSRVRVEPSVPAAL